MGLVEELGSGVKLMKYTKKYIQEELLNLMKKIYLQQLYQSIIKDDTINDTLADTTNDTLKLSENNKEGF